MVFICNDETRTYAVYVFIEAKKFRHVLKSRLVSTDEDGIGLQQNW